VAEDGNTLEAEAALVAHVVMVLLSKLTKLICAKASPQIIFALVVSVMLVSAKMSPVNDVVVPSVAELPT
jgi:hypothetical protein